MRSTYTTMVVTSRSWPKAVRKGWGRSLLVAVLVLLALSGCDSEEPKRRARVTPEQARASLCNDLSRLVGELRQNPGRLPEGSLQELVRALEHDARLYEKAGDPVAAKGIEDFVAALEFAHRNAGQRQLAVYLTRDVTRPQRRKLARLLASTPQVISARYVSKQEAFAELERLYKDDPELLAELPGDLPASFRVRIRSPDQLEEMSRVLAAQPGVDQVQVWSGYDQPLAPADGLAQLCSRPRG